MGFSTGGGEGGVEKGLKDSRGTINISGRRVFSPIGYGWAALFVFVFKVMSCRFSSHTYCTVLLFQKQKNKQQQKKPEDLDSCSSYQGLDLVKWTDMTS